LQKRYYYIAALIIDLTLILLLSRKKKYVNPMFPAVIQIPKKSMKEKQKKNVEE